MSISIGAWYAAAVNRAVDSHGFELATETRSSPRPNDWESDEELTFFSNRRRAVPVHRDSVRAGSCRVGPRQRQHFAAT